MDMDKGMQPQRDHTHMTHSMDKCAHKGAGPGTKIEEVVQLCMDVMGDTRLGRGCTWGGRAWCKCGQRCAAMDGWCGVTHGMHGGSGQGMGMHSHGWMAHARAQGLAWMWTRAHSHGW